MKLLSRNELRSLVDQQGGPCVSIFMPTHEAGADIQEDPIRFKNHLREAEEHLRAHGMREPELKEFTRPAWELMESRLAWRNPKGGFALFLAPGFCQYYGLPLKVEDLVTVSDRFHIKPLLRLFSYDGRFYVMALSQDEIRLFEATQHSVRELPLGPVPPNMNAVHKYLDIEDDVRMQDASGRVEFGGGGVRQGVTGGKFTGSGHGASPEDVVDKKERYREYFKEVDKGLRELIGDDNAPLVIAAVDYLHPIYRSANTYPYLMPEGIIGNPELLGAETLQEQAYDIVRPYFTTEERQAVSKFENLTGTGKTSTELSEILAAANDGRVESLFVAVGVQQWGRFNYELREAEVHTQPTNGDSDLLDLAAVRTFQTGGRVFAVDQTAVPGAAQCAAIFRY